MTETSVRPYAVVTGASSGIGFELAKQFVQNGFDVLIAAEDAEVHRAATTLEEAGASVTALQVDLATREGVEHLADQITLAGRPLDAIALNAGTGNAGAFVDSDLDRDLELIQLNVAATVHLAKRVLPAMVARHEGKLLFTASVASVMPGPYYSTYAASKAFVLSFAEALRYEL
jgi:short-subunit dehydrogenase